MHSSRIDPASISHAVLDWKPAIIHLLTAFPDFSDGIFTNFSHEPTWRWYFAITPFEAFFLGIILTQFAVLNLFGIFPLNLNGVINGMGGRRRKRDSSRPIQRNADIAEQLLKLMKKLDPDQCSFKSICELEFHSMSSQGNNDTSASIKTILNGLKILSHKRRTGELQKWMNDSTNNLKNLDIPGINKDSDDIIALYEEAVHVGDRMETDIIDQSEDDSPCKKKYHRCPVSGEEIMSYAQMIQSIDDILEF